MLELFLAAFFGLPVAAVVWFCVSFDKWRKSPADSDERRRKKIIMIISAIVSVGLVAAVIGLMIWFAIGIAHM